MGDLSRIAATAASRYSIGGAVLPARRTPEDRTDPPEAAMTSSTDTALPAEALASGLKSAMRRMPSSVALITTRDPETGMPAGLAASAVIPVSMEPPSMLISINRNASAHSVIERAGQFCVNLLGVEQTALVTLFSNSDMRDKRFAHESWGERSGLPFLADAPSSIFCKVARTMVFGTHELFVGEVFDIHLSEADEPLGWLEGGFHRLGRIFS